MKRPPKRIEIKGKWYKVKYKRNMKNEYGEEIVGYVCKDKRIIYLCPDQKPTELRATFIHECFHAVIKECNLNELVTHEGEETIVANLEGFIMEKFKVSLK